MRKVFTLIIFGLVFSQLSAQQLSNGGTESTPSTISISQEANAKSSGIESLAEMPLIRVYPNPAEEQLHINVSDKMVGNTVRIYNLLGSEMASRYVSSGHEAIDISGLQQGLYIYNIIDKNNKTVLSGKFNKQ